MENEKIEKIYKIASKLIKALNEKDLIKTLDVIQEAYEEDLVEEVSRFKDQKLTAVIDDLLRKNGLIYINGRPAGVKEIYNLAIGGYIRDLYLLSGEKDNLKLAG